MVIDLLHYHLGSAGALTADYKLSGSRIVDTYALEVVVFNRSFVISHGDVAYTGRTAGHHDIAVGCAVGLAEIPVSVVLGEGGECGVDWHRDDFCLVVVCADMLTLTAFGYGGHSSVDTKTGRYVHADKVLNRRCAKLLVDMTGSLSRDNDVGRIGNVKFEI